MHNELQPEIQFGDEKSTNRGDADVQSSASGVFLFLFFCTLLFNFEGI
jgi:hypothetical protein